MIAAGGRECTAAGEDVSAPPLAAPGRPCRGGRRAPAGLACGPPRLAPGRPPSGRLLSELIRVAFGPPPPPARGRVAGRAVTSDRPDGPAGADPANRPPAVCAFLRVTASPSHRLPESPPLRVTARESQPPSSARGSPPPPFPPPPITARPGPQTWLAWTCLTRTDLTRTCLA